MTLLDARNQAWDEIAKATTVAEAREIKARYTDNSGVLREAAKDTLRCCKDAVRVRAGGCRARLPF